MTDVYLHPGELVASAEPATVTTVLGSCVSVTLWDRTRRIGGVNHFLLPHSAGTGTSSPRFGNVAMRSLFDEVLRLGARRADLEAKVFGGARVIHGAPAAAGHLGERNITIALDFLRGEGLDVVGGDTGGSRGRKLRFLTGDGSAWLRSL
jgi:chemotaxis protein CheD